MLIKPLEIKDVHEVIPEPKYDTRGFFMRVYDEQEFVAAGIAREWQQENHSRSERKGIIRGLHFQFPPYTEAKLVRVVKGAVYDVFVDIRKGSPTFGKWGAVELSEENKKQLFIPRGFAHGFCTLTEISEIVYKVDSRYHPEAEGGIMWDDPEVAIDWPCENPVLSEKDMCNGRLKDLGVGIII